MNHLLASASRFWGYWYTSLSESQGLRLRRKHRLFALLLPLLFCTNNLNAFQHPTQKDPLVDSLLHLLPRSLQPIVQRPEHYRLQIIYTEINHLPNGEVELVPHNYRLGAEYYYPASLVKFPLILMTLDKLNRWKHPVNKFTPLSIEENYDCQTEVRQDTTCPGGLPTLANYIAKILLYSNNDAYNRLYEFLGQEYIARQFINWDIEGAKVVMRFNGKCDSVMHQHTNAFNFFDNDSNLIYRQPPANNTHYVPSKNKIIIGKNEEIERWKYSGKGKDFGNSNALPLQVIHDMVVGVFYPEKVPLYDKISLSQSDRQFLVKHMGLYPRESDYTVVYDTIRYHDSNKKYLVYGQSEKDITRPSLRIFNMVGLSYGFLTDVAYIVDFKNKRDFFLTATVYTNKNQVMNDNRYEYRTLGLPFLKALGKTFLLHERKKSPQKHGSFERWQEWLVAKTTP